MLTKTAEMWYIKNPPRKTRVSAVFKSLNMSSKVFEKSLKKLLTKFAASDMITELLLNNSDKAP